MNKLMKIKLILNKKNKSATLQLPKKNFSREVRDKISKSSYAWLKFEGFE